MPLLLTDEGTRYAHYMELLDLWESALVSIDDYSFESKNVAQRKKELEAAVFVLRKQLDTLADFDDNRFYLRRMVNAAHEENKNNAAPQ